MQDVKSQILSCKKEIEYHLNNELLPFWFDRSMDKIHGGYITHFDKDGKDTGEDEKSNLISSGVGTGSQKMDQKARPRTIQVMGIIWNLHGF